MPVGPAQLLAPHGRTSRLASRKRTDPSESYVPWRGVIIAPLSQHSLFSGRSRVGPHDLRSVGPTTRGDQLWSPPIRASSDESASVGGSSTDSAPCDARLVVRRLRHRSLEVARQHLPGIELRRACWNRSESRHLGMRRDRAGSLLCLHRRGCRKTLLEAAAGLQIPPQHKARGLFHTLHRGTI